MRRTSLILLLAVGTAPLWLVGPAEAECGAPEVSVSPGRVHTGGEITVSGTYWNDICNDTYVDVGCEERPVEPPRPSQDVQVRLIDRETHRGWELAIVDANDDFAFELNAAIDVSPGHYIVRAQGQKDNLRASALLRVLRELP
jgi:hypothetical protein